MVTIAYITMSIAIFLLCWFLFSPEAPTKKVIEQQPVTALVSQKSTDQIGSAEDWTILAYYTPKVYDWLEDKVNLSKCDKVACQQLRDRLETSVQWTDKNKQVHAGVSRIEYEAIHIMNNITNRTLTISWKDNEVIAGTWIDFGAHSEYIRVEDSK